MRIRNNTANNDWTFGFSELDYLADNQKAAALNIKTRLQEWQRDFFAGLTNGVDYSQWLALWGTKERLDEDVRRVITETDEVLRLIAFSSDFDHETSIYNANFSVITIYSNEPLEGLEVTVGNGI